MSDWNWSGTEEKESLVVKSVQAIAVYSNASGEIVIRQQSALGDEDSFIIIPRTNAAALVKAIKDEAKRPHQAA